ncbi:ABC transporter substrate-binding protein [Kozakia baliensis]|uniref:ABC transporter substrate-binding protein n=1 Tax=Kozakia baliensis TaxID=153496 RepID=UPI00345BB014
MKALLRGAMAVLWVPAFAWAAPPQRIVDAWYAHNATLLMLGASDRVVATVVTPQRFPWMYRVAPVLKKAEIINTTSVNAEELLRLQSDLVFVPTSLHAAPALRAVGLNVAEEGFDRFEGLLDCVSSTAELLQDEQAKSQAQAYRTAFTRALAQSGKGRNAPAPRVLHIASLHPLQIDGDQSIIDQWIRHAGGVNAAQGVHGNKRPVTIEQILVWNPDIVILGADAGDTALLTQDPLWQRVKAVQDRRVYRNPAGVFNWDRYSAELLLQLEWSREIIQGGKVDRPAMIARIRDFYRRFYRYDLGDADATRILDAEPPTAKNG